MSCLDPEVIARCLGQDFAEAIRKDHEAWEAEQQRRRILMGKMKSNRGLGTKPPKPRRKAKKKRKARPSGFTQRT